MGKLLMRLPRKVAGALVRYWQRLGRWIIVLSQVRGVSWSDQFKLLASAILAPATSLANLSEWQDPILLFDAAVRVGGIGTFHVRRKSDDLWHVLPWREREIHQTLRQLLRPGDIFIDGGANIGVYTVLASRLVGTAGRVLAIEMMPDTAAILRRHVRDNGCQNVTIVERALSDRTNDTVTARVIPGKFGQASIAQSNRGEDAFEERKVQTATLDDLCSGFQRIRLMKLDLEAAELQALAGSKSVMKRTEAILFEAHTSVDQLGEAFERAEFHVTQALGKDRLTERKVEIPG